MLIYCDSFDHIVQKGTDAAFDVNSPLGRLGWGLANSSWGKCLVVNPGKGRWGTNRLDLHGQNVTTKRFTINRSCSRVVLGIAFQPAADSIISSWVDGYPVYNPLKGPVTEFTIGFGYGAFENFRVNAKLTTAQGDVPSYYDKQKYSGLSFSYTTGNGSGYPAIESSPYISVPLVWNKDTSVSNNLNNPRAFTFLEIYIDVADYKNGTVKIAVNGTTVHTLTGIATAAYNGFGDDPFDPRAKINTINFGKATTEGGAFLFIDSMYVCDETGGYQDDFLGDIFVKAEYPKADGSRRDFTPYINGLQQPDDVPHYWIIGDLLFDPANEADYIQADQDLAQELMSFDEIEIPDESKIIAVNHRTAARSVASVGTPPPNTLVPLFKAIGNDTLVTDSLAKKFTGWAYQFLDTYWTLVPGFVIPWTEQLINNSEFGFLLREPVWTGVEVEGITLSDEVIDE